MTQDAQNHIEQARVTIKSAQDAIQKGLAYQALIEQAQDHAQSALDAYKTAQDAPLLQTALDHITQAQDHITKHAQTVASGKQDTPQDPRDVVTGIPKGRFVPKPQTAQDHTLESLNAAHSLLGDFLFFASTRGAL